MMTTNIGKLRTDFVANTAMENQSTLYNDNLELYLTQIGRLFDIPSIVNATQGNQAVIDYYTVNKLLYRLGHNWEGFMHCGLSYDGKNKKEDFQEHARICERYIRDTNAKKVLELGYGMGPNSAFLARRNPLVTFDGIDLTNEPLKRFTKIPNLHFQLGDFHDLSAFEDDAYDIVFTFEVFCHSTNKPHALREVKKKLKKNGLFIVIDAYRRDRSKQLNQSEHNMAKLIEHCFALETFEYIEDVEGYMQEEFSIARAQDVTQHILPCMAKAHWSRYYFSHPMFARAVNKLLPFDLVKNIIIALLIPISVQRQIACYYIHVLKNDK